MKRIYISTSIAEVAFLRAELLWLGVESECERQGEDGLFARCRWHGIRVSDDKAPAAVKIIEDILRAQARASIGGVPRPAPHAEPELTGTLWDGRQAREFKLNYLRAARKGEMLS